MHVKPEKRLQWAREVLVQHGTKEDFLEKAGAFSSNAIAAPGKCCERRIEQPFFYSER